MPETGGAFARVRELIHSEMLEHSIPSLALAVARDGEVLWQEGFGWADRERRLPATAHTMYSLASISKPITATGAMVLNRQSKLDLDRPIDDYLGQARLNARAGSAAEATVRRVAAHTAGLPLHYHFFYADEPYRRPPMDETIRRYATLITAPGERFHYSNLGYGLLDDVLARLSGQSYADFMRREVFLPLGMTRASVDIGPGLEEFTATRYGSDGLPYPFYGFDHPGGSAVFCSAHDLLRFGMFHLKTRLPDQRAILTDEQIDAMQARATSPNASRAYGFGWALNDDECGYRSIGHGGGMGGVSTELRLIPSERIAAVALCNASCGLPWRVVQELFTALLPNYAERRTEQERKEQEQQKEQQKPEQFQPPPELLGEWRGAVSTYAGERALTLRFKADGDIHAQIGDQLRTLVNEAHFEEGFFSGKMLGDIGTDDAGRRPYQLRLDLKPRGDTLNGALVAETIYPHDEGGAPGKRVGNALAYWTELKKQDPAP
jgi:CubicO group peptidase (beta-lactamase class C family)